MDPVYFSNFYLVQFVVVENRVLPYLHEGSSSLLFWTLGTWKVRLSHYQTEKPLDVKERQVKK